MTASKYARIERERRFLVREVPGFDDPAPRRIIDLYIEGTRIRLRRSESSIDGHKVVERKLTQKLPDVEASGGRRGTITTMYLDEAEYQHLSVLPGRWLAKTRARHEAMTVDVFEGNLHGLVIAEVEFDDDHAMEAFSPPTWCGAEITENPGFSGANLARIAALDPSAAARELQAIIVQRT